MDGVSIFLADEEFDALCFDYGLELDEVVSFEDFGTRSFDFRRKIDDGRKSILDQRKGDNTKRTRNFRCGGGECERRVDL